MKLTMRILSAGLLLSTSLWSMDKKLREIQPYSDQPITSVPDYFYANCNQCVLKEYANDELDSLKQKASSYNKENFLRTYAEQNQAKIEKFDPKDISFLDARKLKQEYIRDQEHCDWIYAVNFLDQFLFAGDIVSSLKNDIKRRKYLKIINSKITRLTRDTADQFRTEDMTWRICSFSELEEVFNSQIIIYPHRFGLQIKNHTVSVQKLKDIFIGIYNQEKNIRLKFGKEYFKNKGIADIEKCYSDQLQYEIMVPDLDLDSFNLSEIDNWATKENPEIINIITWLNERLYQFPSPEKFTQELKKISICMYDEKLSHIERAAYVWYYLIRMHLFNEANKRTAKVVASGLLLKAGYLPPLITGDDGKKYVEILIDCFKKENPQAFIEFIHEMVEKTQQMAKDGLLDVTISTTTFNKDAYDLFVNDLRDIIKGFGK